MSSEAVNLNLQSYIRWAIGRSRGIAVRTSLIYDRIVYTGRWPELTLSKLTFWLRRMAADGQLACFRRGGVNFYRLHDREEG